MHALVQTLPTDRLLLQQAPILLAALLLAETFYKFHSFTLECVAFLGTWYLLDAAVTAIRGVVGRRRQGDDRA